MNQSDLPKAYTDGFGNPWIEIRCEYKGEPAIAKVSVSELRLKVEGKSDEPQPASGS